jgi:hypothetical protein
VLGGAIHSPSIFARISESKVMSGFVIVMGLLATAVTTAEGVKALTAGPPTPEHVQVVIQQITPVPDLVMPVNPAPSSPTDVRVIGHGHDDEKGGG